MKLFRNRLLGMSIPGIRKVPLILLSHFVGRSREIQKTFLPLSINHTSSIPMTLEFQWRSISFREDAFEVS